MIRTYTMRLKTTKRQSETLDRLLAQLCELYNMALQQRRDVWKSHHKTIGYYDQQKQLTELRGGVEEYRVLPSSIQRDSLRRIDRAFKAFFRRLKSKEKPGFPRFKNRDRYDSFSVDKTNFTFKENYLRIPKLGVFQVKSRCRVKGVPLELRVKRCGKKWQAQVVCDIGPAPEKIAVRSAVGIDFGLTSLATLSDGTEINNPRWMKKEKDHLSETARQLEAKRKGSKNRKKSRERLRRAHQRVIGKRNSYLTQIAKDIVGKYDLVAHEKLAIRNMTKSHLAASIFDAAWGNLIRHLNCEAEKAGKWVIPVDPYNTTQACSGCGRKVPKQLKDRWHSCFHCGLELDRDHNAALNILALGESGGGNSRMLIKR